MTKEELVKIVQSNTEASWQTANIIEAIESYEQNIRAKNVEEKPPRYANCKSCMYAYFAELLDS